MATNNKYSIIYDRKQNSTVKTTKMLKNAGQFKWDY